MGPRAPLGAPAGVATAPAPRGRAALPRGGEGEEESLLSVSPTSTSLTLLLIDGSRRVGTAAARAPAAFWFEAPPVAFGELPKSLRRIAPSEMDDAVDAAVPDVAEERDVALSLGLRAARRAGCGLVVAAAARRGGAAPDEEEDVDVPDDDDVSVSEEWVLREVPDEPLVALSRVDVDVAVVPLAVLDE